MRSAATLSAHMETMTTIPSPLEASPIFIETPAPSLNIHVGRSFTGHRVEDDCPCPQAQCGLIEEANIMADCPQHSMGAARTIRQGHSERACPANYLAIEAWETDQPTLVVWGTHDPALAVKAAEKYYQDTVSPEDIPEGLLGFLSDEAARLWANPDVLGIDDEGAEWPRGMISRESCDGFVPYMAVTF